MTPATRKVLEALAAADLGTLATADLRRAAKVTNRGWHAVRSRMEDAGLVEPAPYYGVPRLTITEQGRAAIASR